MKNPLVGGVLAAVALMVTFGSGSASADNEYVGQTYEAAARKISQWGTPVVWTREGSYLPTDKCIVVGSKYAKTLDSSGQRRDYGRVLLDLNCNDTSAKGDHPGYSAMTPQGQKEAQQRADGTKLSTNYEKAVAADKTPWCDGHEETCVQVCQAAGNCSKELRDFLGM